MTFEGDYYRTEDARIFDRPDVPVPVYVAAGGPLVARYAGRSGDGFICTSGKGRELYADKLLPAVAEGLDKGGRSGGDIDRMIEIKVSWDPDAELALENTRFWAPLSLTAEQKHSIHSPAEMEKAADELPIEQVAKRWIVASSPEDVVAAVKEYTDLGFDHLVFHGPGHDQERFLRTFTEQVVPGLRELVPADLTSRSRADGRHRDLLDRARRRSRWSSGWRSGRCSSCTGSTRCRAGSTARPAGSSRWD